jgi:hypothetical protein
MQLALYPSLGPHLLLLGTHHKCDGPLLLFDTHLKCDGLLLSHSNCQHRPYIIKFTAHCERIGSDKLIKVHRITILRWRSNQKVKGA